MFEVFFLDSYFLQIFDVILICGTNRFSKNVRETLVVVDFNVINEHSWRKHSPEIKHSDFNAFNTQ